ncbi:MAG: ribbon-helix-helix protein, CopG family [Candidatus Rokubacteria bacterium]|nr:ribbon-helix-helix protein, CopG family [Candidatus Rokubacteria bacterium]
MTRPLQVYVEDAELVRLDEWSRQRGWTKSQAVRAAIRALTRAPATDPVLELSGYVDGLPAVCSDHFERYLKETVVAETAPRYRSRRAGRRLRRQ